jgi:murein DD-endopeptidase MepM/ murein hydrolase activator NlpD
MIERIDYLIYKLRFVVPGLLIVIVGLFMMWALIAGFRSAQAEAATQSDVTANVSAASTLDSPNAITRGLTIASSSFGHTINVSARSGGSGLKTAAATAGHAGLLVGRGSLAGVMAVLHGVGTGLGFMAGAAANTVTFIVHIPVKVIGVVSRTPGVSAVIQPAANVDHNDVPIIKPDSPDLIAAREALPATLHPAPTPEQPAPAPVVVAMWPIHGVITTEFGVPEPPYQAVHTGIDISDAARSGVTPVHAYRQGKVIATEHTGGLGNHVIVDHGNGVTSVYGHLAFISVTVGQLVDTNTTLGLEGTTGVSTGVHVHFEIRVNGQATNPHLFISGTP